MRSSRRPPDVAGFLARVKSAMREKEESRRYFELSPEERPVTVYVEDDYTWNQLAGYVEELTGSHGRRIAYVTSQADDPRLDTPPEGVSAFYVRELVPQFLPKVDSPVFVTTMPDLDRFHVRRPRDSTCVYLFHSLNSTHMAYRTGAFDAYDVLGTTGPYQKRELEARYAAIGKTGYQLAEVGYYKLDRIAEGYRSYRAAHPSETTVLIAPSWGEHNLLAVCGADLVGSVAAQGFRTIVRPHPAFFESIYPAGQAIVDDLRRRFADRENVVFETSITSESSFYEAALMISDWSGAAFEYAFGTERPALFVDVERKVMSPEWESLGIVPFEERMRDELGGVIAPDDARRAGEVVSTIVETASEYGDRIRAARDRELFNFGSAAAAGAALVDSLVPG
jgi:YidC/Oxa1 family membrane protein insertase